MKWSCTFAILALAGHSLPLLAQSLECKRNARFVEDQLEASSVAFRAKVVEAEQVRGPQGAAIQGAMFQVLDSLKGKYGKGALVHLTVNLTHACSGPDCRVSIDVGDEMLVVYPGAPRRVAPMFYSGCWEYRGLLFYRILSVSLIDKP
jgi:hypothetical protein